MADDIQAQNRPRVLLAKRRAAGLKRCWKCREEKTLTSFAKSKNRSDGLEPQCRSCVSLYRRANRERERLRHLEYCEANREKVNADARRRYDPAKERIRRQKRDPAIARASGKKWREANRDKANTASREAKRRLRAITREADRRYSQQNKEKIREKGRNYRTRKAIELKQKQAEYIRNHRGQVNARTAKRTAAKLNATPPWVDLKAIEVVYIEAARLTRETGVAHEVDHYYPLQGKTSCGLHVSWNLRISTRSVNRSKGNRLPEDILDGEHSKTELPAPRQLPPVPRSLGAAMAILALPEYATGLHPR